jgi:SAM-dependent methyltransferase
MSSAQAPSETPAAVLHQVRWERSLLEADLDDAVEAWKVSLHGFAKRLPPLARARFLMQLDSSCYFMHGESAQAANNGLHPKHRLLNYHAFYTDNIPGGSCVIDLGSGVGALALAIATTCKSSVTGIDWTPANVESSRARVAAAGVDPAPTFIVGDITATRAPGQFDTIALSNVLEHITDRVARLRLWQNWYSPRQFLIRVPAFDRDWRVAWKRELGVEWRCDPTHETEYSQDELETELREAGLMITSLHRRWGEFYCIAKPLTEGGRS